MMNGVDVIKTHIVVGAWSEEYIGHGFTKSMKELERISTMLEELHSAIGKYDLQQNLYLFSWEGMRVVMVPPEVKPQLPKPEVNIEENLLNPDIILEVENQCDVEVDTTSVEVSVEIS
ncbi:hypothetical protein Tco_0340362 [Tanacetum coccineum]